MTTRWSLRVWLLTAALGAVFITTALGGIAMWGSARVAERMRTLYETRTESLVLLDMAGRTLERQRAGVLATMAAPNDITIDSLNKQIREDDQSMESIQRQLKSMLPDSGDQARLDSFGQALSTMRTGGLQKILDFLSKGQTIEADVASQAVYLPKATEATRSVDELIKTQVEAAKNDYRAAEELIRRQTLITSAAVVLALALGILMSVLILRAVRRSLGADEAHLVRAAFRLASGRLGERISGRSEYGGSVAASLDAMSQEFSKLVSGVATAAAWVARSTVGLADSSSELSRRTGEQTAKLEETARSMEQLASTVRRNSDNARHARELAHGASEIADRGSRTMDEVVSTMKQIAESSRRISEIVGLIDDIAFQTNLLSLNAAVEAARAGEQGRGFAVVAREVRVLAQRSAMAAHEIKNLIGDSSARVTTGVRLVGGAGEVMNEFVAATEQVTSIVSDIAQASREQFVGIEQVNRAVGEVKNWNGENALAARRTAEEAQNMKMRADSLVDSVSRFSIADSVALEVDQTLEFQSTDQAVVPGCQTPTRTPHLKSVSKSSVSVAV